MTNTIIGLYITLTPVIIGGIINSAFCTSTLLRCLEIPIDFHKTFVDNKRIFGNSKTFKGFLGYVFFITVVTVIWGLLGLHNEYIAQHNFFYQLYENTLLFNLRVGVMLGLAWALFELPNSFMKRRLDIGQSNALTGAKRVFFIVLDQADSIFGITLVIALYYPITVVEYFVFVAIGTVTHLLFNYLLFLAKLRTQPV